MKKFPLGSVLLLALCVCALAQDKSTADKNAGKAAGKSTEKDTVKINADDPKIAAALEAMRKAREIEKQLKFQQGKIALDNGQATLNVPATFRYLDPPQTNKVLTDLWGNPPREKPTLGMLFPAEGSIVGGEAWGVVITYQDDGYVEDKEAANLNYDNLLKQMREDEDEVNAERKQAGYESIHLVGWAAPPHYDKAAHKLYWAKELAFGDEPEHTLNYDIRVLGRKGVLSLNAVANMKQLPDITRDMQAVLQFVEFNPGARYGDYQAGLDKVAAYGIGALIAGKLVAKAGLFKLLLGVLIAGKKFVVLGLAALGAFLKRLFSGRSANEDTPA